MIVVLKSGKAYAAYFPYVTHIRVPEMLYSWFLESVFLKACENAFLERIA